MKVIELNEYQKLAGRTSRPFPTPVQDLQHAQLGIASEGGEIADTLKKHIAYNQPLDTENLKEELGDLMWYVALGATALGMDLSDICEANIDKLRKRYPDKYSDEHAAARADKVEPVQGELFGEVQQ
jgi:NTP pyrophosphatase (non-canonical NTP hydrolase)